MAVPHFVAGDPTAETLSFRQHSWINYRTGRIGVISANRPHRMARFQGQLDIDRLQLALRWLARRATIVTARATERHGRPYLRCFPDTPPSIEQYWAAAGNSATALAEELVWRPFSLLADPLARAFVIHGPDGASLVGLVAHHIVADDVSVRMMWADLWRGYLGNRSESGARVQYTDYLASMNNWREGMTARAQLSALIADLAPLAGRGVDDGGRTRESRFLVPMEHLVALHRRAATERVTLACVLLALQFMALAAISGEPSQIISTVVSGREHPRLLLAAGYLADKTYHYVDIGQDAALGVAIQQTWKALAHAAGRQFVRSDFVREELLERGLDVRAPAFNFRPAARRAVAPGSGTSASAPGQAGFTLVPVSAAPPAGPRRPGNDVRDYSLELKETPDGLQGRLLALSANGDAFGRIYTNLIAQIAEGAEPKIVDVAALGQ